MRSKPPCSKKERRRRRKKKKEEGMCDANQVANAFSKTSPITDCCIHRPSSIEYSSVICGRVIFTSPLPLNNNELYFSSSSCWVGFDLRLLYLLLFIVFFCYLLLPLIEVLWSIKKKKLKDIRKAIAFHFRSMACGSSPTAPHHHLRLISTNSC